MTDNEQEKLVAQIEFRTNQMIQLAFARAKEGRDWHTETNGFARQLLTDLKLVRLDENRPKVICLCGSTRFTAEMLAIHWTFAKEGIICLGWEVYPTEEPADHLAEKQGIAEQFDELHKRKIDLADEVFILNIGGYIGQSTRSEIEYANKIGKPVKYLEQVSAV